MRNLHRRFVLCSASQIYGGDFAKFYSLLRIYELYLLSKFTMNFLNICSTPAYDWAPNPDKQWILQVTDRMEPIHKKFTDVLMTKRLQTLQSIDEAIERVRKKE